MNDVSDQQTVNNDQLHSQRIIVMKSESVVYKKAYQFAIRIVKACQFLTNQKRNSCFPNSWQGVVPTLRKRVVRFPKLILPTRYRNN